MFLHNFRIWQKYLDGIIVLAVSFGLIGIYSILLYFFFDQLRKHQNDPESDDELANKGQFVLAIMSSVVLTLSLLTTPFAIYFSATNDRLTLPIRLLATAENITKFVSAFGCVFWYFCEFRIEGLKCSDALNSTATFVNLIFNNTYCLTDIAQYCQFLISLSRFLVVSFDSRFFRYTLKWPLAQLVFPFILRIAMQHGIFDFWAEREVDYGMVANFFSTLPYFFTCGLDYVTNRKMKMLKRSGKASRVESLLMIQMLANSMLIFMNYIVAYFIGIMISLYFGWSVLNVFDSLVDFNQYLFFHLFASVISALCLRKRKDRAHKCQNVKRLSVTTIKLY